MSKNKQLEEEARKRRTSSVFSGTYGNGGWSERDSLPSGDPIGDVDEPKNILPIKNGVYDPYVESYKKRFQKDQESYEQTMKGRLINPDGKKFEHQINEIKCDCGTEATYGKVPLNAHPKYCSLRG
jgi:hypothetical protein